MKKIALSMVAFLVMFSAFFVAISPAAAYPDKPVTVVVPYSPGGASDITARLLAEYWKKYTGKEMVVTNVVGAEGAVAARQVLNTKADGYTVLWYHQAILGNYYLGVADISWKDLTPACVVMKTSRVTVTRNSSPWKNLREALDDAKKNPKKYIYGAGAGGIAYLEYGPLEMDAPGAFRVVPNEGGDAQRITALLGNHVDAIPVALISVVQYLKSGDIKCLALHDVESDPFIPDVPTASSQNIKNLVFPMTNTFFFPKNTSQNIVNDFNGIIAKIVVDPEFKKKLADMAYTVPFFKTGKDLEKFWSDQDSVYKEVAKYVK
jgi:tripartite-type tricarboxylate transporter receptor subunit TctC